MAVRPKRQTARAEGNPEGGGRRIVVYQELLPNGRRSCALKSRPSTHSTTPPAWRWRLTPPPCVSHSPCRLFTVDPRAAPSEDPRTYGGVGGEPGGNCPRHRTSCRQCPKSCAMYSTQAQHRGIARGGPSPCAEKQTALSWTPADLTVLVGVMCHEMSQEGVPLLSRMSRRCG